MIRRVAVCAFALVLFTLPAAGQEYKVAKVDSPAPTGAVAPEITSLLQPTGFQLAKGGSAFVEVWLAKEWPIAADAKASGDLNYALTPGQLIGVARYAKKGADFRDQPIPAGTYVMRYAQQPVDGAHVGTSPTRDFLLLLPADKDREPKTMEYKTLTATSKETTGTAHPAILSLQAAEAGGAPLAVIEDAERMWVIVHFVGKAKEASGVKDLPLNLVVVGKAVE
jgi:hypothetical protein